MSDTDPPWSSSYSFCSSVSRQLGNHSITSAFIYFLYISVCSGWSQIWACVWCLLHELSWIIKKFPLLFLRSFIYLFSWSFLVDQPVDNIIFHIWSCTPFFFVLIRTPSDNWEKMNLKKGKRKKNNVIKLGFCRWIFHYDYKNGDKYV